jgi:hypothetical protein
LPFGNYTTWIPSVNSYLPINILFHRNLQPPKRSSFGRETIDVLRHFTYICDLFHKGEVKDLMNGDFANMTEDLKLRLEKLGRYL